MKTEQIINAIHGAECHVTLVAFEEIFGERMGNHLWDKFVTCNRSLIRLWGQLDHTNREKLVEYIDQQR